MGEGRNLELEIERKARKKAMQGTAIVICFTIIMLLLTVVCLGEISLVGFIVMVILIPLICIGCFYLLKGNYIEMEEEKIIREVVEREVPIAFIVSNLDNKDEIIIFISQNTRNIYSNEEIIESVIEFLSVQ